MELFVGFRELRFVKKNAAISTNNTHTANATGTRTIITKSTGKVVIGRFKLHFRAMKIASH
jgi:hypothetical protein